MTSNLLKRFVQTFSCFSNLCRNEEMKMILLLGSFTAFKKVTVRRKMLNTSKPEITSKVRDVIFFRPITWLATKC